MLQPASVQKQEMKLHKRSSEPFPALLIAALEALPPGPGAAAAVLGNPGARVTRRVRTSTEERIASPSEAWPSGAVMAASAYLSREWCSQPGEENHPRSDATSLCRRG